jgi:uncharacterized membrane protein YhiD involved in acid resistance
MNTFQSKKKIHKILSHKLVISLAVVLTVLLLVSTFGLYQKKKQVMKLRNTAEIEFQTTVEKNTSVDQDLKKVDSPHGRERLIRQKYNVKKPGEQVIVVTENNNTEKELPVVNKNLYEQATDFLSRFF